MVALAAIALFAQTISISVGGGKKDSVKVAHADSIQVEREMRRDSMRVRRARSDSVNNARRVAKRIPLTPAKLATAFRDPGARALLTSARVARL